MARALGFQPSGPGSIPGRTKSVMITLSRHLCASPNVGHARRSRPVLNYRITDSGSLDQSNFLSFDEKSLDSVLYTVLLWTNLQSSIQKPHCHYLRTITFFIFETSHGTVDCKQLKKLIP